MQEKELNELMAKAKELTEKDILAFEELEKALTQFLEHKAPRRPRRIKGSAKAGKIIMHLATTIALPPRFNEFIRNMSLVYLISIFENFMGRILEIAFWQQPKALIPTQKTVSVEELLECKDIKSVKGKLIVKAIDSIMHGGIDEIDNQLLQKWKIKLSSLAGWKKFRERFYRRNLIVHTSGRIDSTYRLKTGYKGKARVLTVSEKYLLESTRLFEDVGLSLVEAFHSKLKSGP